MTSLNLGLWVERCETRLVDIITREAVMDDKSLLALLHARSNRELA